MEMSDRLSPYHILFLLFTVLHALSPVHSIGVNYGTIADNLPSPSEVAQFLKESTNIDRIKIYDLNPEILKAFADTDILVTVTLPNGDIPSLTNLDTAEKWVEDNIKPYYPATKFHYICVGNEILHWGSQEEIDNVVPAMKTLHEALVKAGIRDIKITSPQSLGMLLSSDPPSTGAFRPGWDVGVIKPMLEFLNETKSGFMVNPYPYFGYSPGNDSFALFKPNPGLKDVGTGKTYNNMFDVLMDAIYIAMKKLGYPDVEIVVGETGWPSLGEPWLTHVNVENAAHYNGAMIKKASSKQGTPLMPGKSFEIYIFALFNENQKPGSLAERNFGLFRPDFTQVYDIGVMTGPPPKRTPPPAASPRASNATSPSIGSPDANEPSADSEKTPASKDDSSENSSAVGNSSVPSKVSSIHAKDHHAPPPKDSGSTRVAVAGAAAVVVSAAGVLLL